MIATCKKSVDLVCIIFKLELERDISKVHAKFYRIFFRTVQRISDRKSGAFASSSL